MQLEYTTHLPGSDELCFVMQRRKQRRDTVNQVLARRGVIVGDDGKAARHGFQNHVTERFGDARENENVGGRVMPSEIGALAHDALALALPQQLLCRADCAGLCPVCGESLNDVEPGSHDHPKEPDPRFAKLRELLD